MSLKTTPDDEEEEELEDSRYTREDRLIGQGEEV